VDDVLVSWDDDFVCLTLIADQYPAVEIWETQSNALPLLEKPSVAGRYSTQSPKPPPSPAAAPSPIRG
jgi:hypothetical protein